MSARAKATELAATWLRQHKHFPVRDGHLLTCASCGMSRVVLPELDDPHLMGEPVPACSRWDLTAQALIPRLLRADGAVYAGIGSRKTPDLKLAVMRTLGRVLAEKHWRLRTGGAEGADAAFLRGYNEARPRRMALELYLPWRGFNGHLDAGLGGLNEPTPRAFMRASRYHPAWNRLPPGAQKLVARNVHQVLGPDCNSPVDLVICWSPDGATEGRHTTSATGGTGTAIRIADDYAIPVLNLRHGQLLTCRHGFLLGACPAECSLTATLDDSTIRMQGAPP